MPPRLNQKRARFVLSKIDEILAWERRKETEKDTRFVELGRYLCEVRAGQYWRLENLKGFDDFLERRFPESRRKAYYLMSIHEHLGSDRRSARLFSPFAIEQPTLPAWLQFRWDLFPEPERRKYPPRKRSMSAPSCLRR
jgi:hypothetical protein